MLTRPWPRTRLATETQRYRDDLPATIAFGRGCSKKHVVSVPLCLCGQSWCRRVESNHQGLATTDLQSAEPTACSTPACLEKQDWWRPAGIAPASSACEADALLLSYGPIPWCRPPVLPRDLPVFNRTCDFHTRAANLRLAGRGGLAPPTLDLETSVMLLHQRPLRTEQERHPCLVRTSDPIVKESQQKNPAPVSGRGV